MSNYTTIPFNGNFKVTQGEGGSYSHRYIKAMDLVGISSPNIYSTCKGKVVMAGWDPAGFGNYVKIDDGKNYHYLAHMSRINVRTGQSVDYTTLLGVMGSTGNSTGPHTHYEIREKGTNKQISTSAFMGIPNKVGVYNSNDYVKSDRPYNYAGYKCISNMNIRLRAGIDSKIVGLYKAGDEFPIHEEYNGWRKLSFTVGFIYLCVNKFGKHLCGYFLRKRNQ